MDLGKGCYMDGKYFLTIKGIVVKKRKVKSFINLLQDLLNKKKYLLLHSFIGEGYPG